MNYRFGISDDRRAITVHSKDKVLPDVVKREIAEKAGISWDEYRHSNTMEKMGDGNFRFLSVFLKKD